MNPDKTTIENVNVNSLKGINVNHFTIDKDKVVQALILDKVKKVLINGNKERDKTSSPRICIIGAGPSGIAAIKNLQEQGLTRYHCF